MFLVSRCESFLLPRWSLFATSSKATAGSIHIAVIIVHFFEEKKRDANKPTTKIDPIIMCFSYWKGCESFKPYLHENIEWFENQRPKIFQ